MRKKLKNNCKSHQLFKDRAKNRVDDLQGILTDLQFARKQSRTSEVTVLEEQVHQMLREWKSELNEPSPASSLLGGSFGSFSAGVGCPLERSEEEDDATSGFGVTEALKPDPDIKILNAPKSSVAGEDYFENHALGAHCFQEVQEHKNYAPGFVQNAFTNNLELTTQLDYNQLDLPQDLGVLIDSNVMGEGLQDAFLNIPGVLPNICPPPSAFLGPKCALWDCPRPSLGSEWFQDYCSSFHATLALSEGPTGMSPVLRPGGIGLKDGPLFASLSAKTQGKDVGIPECEGAATSKSPWNAPELFDLSVLEGETIREWLFFDKPRRAFESGNRKQRSLPDYSGRGWHESRKQVMKEFGGLKRSYYMDPQPLTSFEWHLYEYEINDCDACALYRLELKLVDRKKTPKGKLLVNDSVADLQKQMRRLTAEFPADNKRTVEGRSKVNFKTNDGNGYFAPYQITSTAETFRYGLSGPYNYLSENLTDYYGT